MQSSLISYSESSENKQTLLDIILRCFRGGASHSLKEIYDNVKSMRPETKESTIRGRLNENNGRLFRRISRGVYIAIQGPAAAVLIEGDAWEKINDIETESVDAAFIDPPYTWHNHYVETGTTRKKEGQLSYETRDIDIVLLKEIFRILKSRKEGVGINNQKTSAGAHLFIFIPAPSGDTWEHIDSLIKDAEHVGFKFNKLFIWDKVTIGMGYNGRAAYEAILFMSKGERVMPYDLTIPDLIEARRPDNSNRVHESEKPAVLYEKLIRFSTRTGDVILDLFAGSANVARAALALGVNCILFEKKHEFIEKISW